MISLLFLQVLSLNTSVITMVPFELYMVLKCKNEALVFTVRRAIGCRQRDSCDKGKSTYIVFNTEINLEMVI